MLRRGQSQAKTAAKLIMIESSEAKGAAREGGTEAGQLADESIELIVIEKFYNYNYMQLLSCSLLSLSLCTYCYLPIFIFHSLSLATQSALLTSIDEHKVARPQVN